MATSKRLHKMKEIETTSRELHFGAYKPSEGWSQNSGDDAWLLHFRGAICVVGYAARFSVAVMEAVFNSIDFSLRLGVWEGCWNIY
jgi:hypothetical protein